MTTIEDDDDRLCPHCGAKMVEYRHGISVPLVTGLRRLLQAGGGPINIRELALTRNQWDNFQKLRYWDLVTQVEIDGMRKKGVWAITELGKLFLFNETKIPNRVWTYRGNRIRYEQDFVSIFQVAGWYEKREDYSSSSQPHGHDDDQFELF